MASIVDYMKERKMDSSYAARKQLAESSGISGYKGTAEQNTKLYNMLKSGTAGGNAGSGGSTAGAQTTTPANVTVGVKTSGNSATTSRGYTPSESVTAAYKAMRAREASMPDDYEESEYVQERRDRLRDVENSKPGEFQSKYREQIDSLLNDIFEDKGFSYTAEDLKNDDLYKMYAEQYQNNAERAMRDTLGSAAALTGGYGSTAAQAAGQQAYDQTMTGLNSKVLDFYDRAYQRYSDDRTDRYNKLGAFQTQDNTDYGRHRDDVADWQTDRAYEAGMLGQEQSNDLAIYNANTANYWNGQNYLAGRYDSELGADFAAYQQDRSDAQWEESFQLQKEAQDLDNDYKRLQIAKLQQDMAKAAAGNGKGGDGTRPKSDNEPKKKTMEWADYYKKWKEINDDKSNPDDKTTGAAGAYNYRNWVRENYDVYGKDKNGNRVKKKI